MAPRIPSTLSAWPEGGGYIGGGNRAELVPDSPYAPGSSKEGVGGPPLL